MKRFVYVPVDSLVNGDIPKEALDLSLESTLSIRMQEPNDGINRKEIHIASFPEKNIIQCRQTVKLGFIHSIDLTNDFVDFDKSAVLKIKNADLSEQIIQPSLREKHVLKFRSRFDSLGKKLYLIENDTKVIYSGVIEVI